SAPASNPGRSFPPPLPRNQPARCQRHKNGGTGSLCAAGWLRLLLLEPQQPLGVAPQDGVLLLVGEGQGAEALQALLLAAPGAVGAEQEPLVSKGTDDAHELLLPHHGQLLGLVVAVVQGADAPQGV